jgi:hypothetical protein
MRRGLILILILGVPAAGWAAAQSSALAKVAGGLWEISGAPGAKDPVRECVADVALLAEFEHRASKCSGHVLSDDGTATLISYKCGTAGFGQAKIEVVTPRSLRISTQGISDQSPFNYVLQARRVGDCAKAPSVTSH